MLYKAHLKTPWASQLLIISILLYHFQIQLKLWERKITFEPNIQYTKETSWVNYKRKSINYDKSNVKSAEKVFSRALHGFYPNIESLSFRNDQSFVSGQLHNNLDEWKLILSDSPDKEEVMN